MGALKGSISVRRYAVVDPLPADVRRKFLKGLRAHAFLPLDPKGEVDRSSGWVSVLDADDTELSTEKVFFVAAGGEQLRVSLRLDVLKPPGGELRRQANARVAAKEAEEGRPLTKREKRALKEEVARTLRQRAFPRVRVMDLIWHLDAQRIYFWAQSKAANELLLDLFVKSFGLAIEPEGAARWVRATVDAKQVAKLEPTRELWLGFDGVRPLPGVAKEDE
jgi:DNA recombination-dependent growth factor C